MKAFLLVTTFLMVSVTLQADNQTPVIVEKRYEIKKDSSEHNRINKKYEALAIVLGNGPNATVHSSGISLGYYFDTNKMIVLEGTSSSNIQNGNVVNFTNSSSDSGDSNTYIKVSSYGVHFKHFTGNSFYYRVGADYRAVDYKYIYKTEEAGFKGDSTTLSFYIGNQWQWDNFTLGCNWVGLSAPMTSNVRETYLNSAAQTDAYFYNDKLDYNTSRFIKNINVNLLRFYLGASF